MHGSGSVVPQIDTNPGIAATVDDGTLPRRASAATAFGAIGAFVLVIGVLASIVFGLFHRSTTRTAATPAVDGTIAVPIATPVATPELSAAEPEVAVPVAAREPDVAAPVASASSSAPKPAVVAPARPAAPVKPRNAEKDGYMKEL